MTQSLLDRSALHALQPLAMAAYLRAHGWREAQQVPGKGSVWTAPGADGGFEILLPVNHDLADFVARLHQAVETLALFEGRSPLDVWEDLTTSGADIVCAVLQRPDAEDGSLPLPDGVQLVIHARDLMLAGACAAVQPRAFFPTRKPSAAAAFVNHLRLGQTRRGSYVLTVLSPVPQGLTASGNGQPFPEMEEPFERQATVVLARALAAVSAAAERAAATGRLEEFQAAIKQGVSANLCQALVGMAGDRSGVQALQFDFSWSPTRPAPADVPRRIRVPADALPIIEEAGRLLRESSPQEEFVLRGMVVRLDRPEGAAVGRVGILGFVEGQPRRVVLEIGEPEYSLAIQAHQERVPIVCTGDLVKEGRTWVLRNLRQFALEPLESLY